MKAVLETAKRFLALKTVTTEGNEEFANELMTFMGERGLRPQLQHVTHSFEGVSKRQFNVLGWVGDPLVDRKIFRGLLLCSSLDTASSGLPENWTEAERKPLVPFRNDARLYGVGATAGKLDFLSKILAAERFKEKKLKQPIYLAGTCLEGWGGAGARYLIKSLAFNPRFVISGAPTDLRIGTKAKSSLQFRVRIQFQNVERDAKNFSRRIDLTAYGKAQHASLAEGSKPENGIEILSDYLKFVREAGCTLRFTEFSGGDGLRQVPDLARTTFYVEANALDAYREIHRTAPGASRYRVELGGLGNSGVRFLPESAVACLLDVMSFVHSLGQELRSPSDADFKPASSTLVPVQLTQGPSWLELALDASLVPTLSANHVVQTLQTGVHSISLRFPELNLSISRDRAVPALQPEQAMDLVRLAEESLSAVALDKRAVALSTGGDAAHYAAAGYPTIAYGAGPMGLLSAANEYVLLDELERGLAFYSKIIERVCT